MPFLLLIRSIPWGTPVKKKKMAWLCGANHGLFNLLNFSLFFFLLGPYPRPTLASGFNQATLPAPVLERLNSTATLPTVKTTTSKTVTMAETTRGPSPTKETTQPRQTEKATTEPTSQVGYVTLYQTESSYSQVHLKGNRFKKKHMTRTPEEIFCAKG